MKLPACVSEVIAERGLLLWECYLHDHFREDDPCADTTLAALWRGVEAALLDRLPAATRVVTTWEDSYDRPTWQAFLAALGYQPVALAAFAKAAR
ncbi:MAG TPA: hypothetical protein VLA19_21595 [Herpetosiphonaceae bacterium]|nr:hypothetical protein [Herpetosiphonaceae bacterium]